MPPLRLLAPLKALLLPPPDPPTSNYLSTGVAAGNTRLFSGIIDSPPLRRGLFASWG